jgi:hypothetical protein
MAKVESDRVRVQLRNDKGKPVLDFKNVPLSDMSKLATARGAELTSARR